MGVHALQVGATGLAVDESVLHRVCEQPQRSDRGSQIVGDGRDEAAPGCLGMIARRLLCTQAIDHRVGLTRELAQLVVDGSADAHVAAAAPDRIEAIADRRDVGEDRTRDKARRERRDRAGGEHDRGDE